MKIVNKKAYYNYQVVEDYIAGIMLESSEVKSLRENDINFVDSYIFFRNNELYIKNMYIARYKEASFQNHDETRERKILLTKRELNKISRAVETKGITIIPLEIFPVRGRFKLKIGICKGKKDWDKRDSIKNRDVEREMRRKEEI